MRICNLRAVPFVLTKVLSVMYKRVSNGKKSLQFNIKYAVGSQFSVNWQLIFNQRLFEPAWLILFMYLKPWEVCMVRQN